MHSPFCFDIALKQIHSRQHEHLSMRISGLVVEYIVAIDVTQVRFPGDAVFDVSCEIVSHLFIANAVPPLNDMTPASPGNVSMLLCLVAGQLRYAVFTTMSEVRSGFSVAAAPR